MSKPNIYIFAGGKSSRFGGRPKILDTFEYNKEILNKYFNVFIVTSKEIYNKISHLEADFIIQEMGNGSGGDVYNLFAKFSQPAFICWSDVFYTEKTIMDIMELSEYCENCMTVTNKNDPYISIVTDNKKLIAYEKNADRGFQDNSLFYIKELNSYDEEFMDMAIKNNFDVKVTETATKYFNTQEELDAIKK